MAEDKVAKGGKKDKDGKKPGRVRRWFKDFFSELKKVTWPSFSKVLKQTGIVLLVTVIFLLVLMGFDMALKQFYDFLIGNIPSASAGEEAVAAAVRMIAGGGLL